MILGMCKDLGVTPEYVLHEMTYENLLMYGYATPVLDLEDKKDDWDPALDANNPENNREQSDGIVTNPFI